MVEIDYIANSARDAARRPGRIIARATLRHLGLPYPATIGFGRRCRHRGDRSYAGIADAFANRESPMDRRM